MKIEYDKEADAAYISLKDIGPGEASKGKWGKWGQKWGQPPFMLKYFYASH